MRKGQEGGQTISLLFPGLDNWRWRTAKVKTIAGGREGGKRSWVSRNPFAGEKLRDVVASSAPMKKASSDLTTERAIKEEENGQ